MFAAYVIFAATHRPLPPPIIGTVREDIAYQQVPRATYNNWSLVGMMREPIPLVDPDDGCNHVRAECNAIINSIPPSVTTDFNGDGVTNSQDFFDFYVAFLGGTP